MVRFAVAVFPLREAVLDTTYQLLSLMLTLQLAPAGEHTAYLPQIATQLTILNSLGIIII